MQSAVRLHKSLPSGGISLNQPITISTPSFTFPMPKWIENCVRFKLPLNINSSNIEICLPSPSSFRNTLVLITSPFKNIYFWIWLIYSFSFNGFKRFDSVILPQPFSQIYSFLLGSTELAAAIKSEILSRIHGNAALSWFFFFYGPELLPGGHNFFESLQYYDDWIETYKLGLLLLPELWGLLNRVLYFCLQLVNLIPKVIFIIALILPFTSFNFVVVRSLSPLLADLFHREFEGNFKIWESHIVEPLICWYIVGLPFIPLNIYCQLFNAVIDAGLYTYQERKPSAGIPWAFFIWFLIALFSSAMFMIAVLFAWDLSFFALPWCFFSVSYLFRGARERRSPVDSRLSESSGGDRDRMWAIGWMNGYREGQIQYRQKLYEMMGANGGSEDEDENQGHDIKNEDHKGDGIDHSRYFYDERSRYNGRFRPVVPNPRPPPQGSTLTNAALLQGDRSLWEGDKL
ncbi:hypothetical protein AOL_s00083g440 [Orbilia oligospora ATCC 24927]|uniref:Uncharacterized protein n=1 Tax=Arthrobotrys oligospora (strain ATCC 24927 / CBS 115.81 / DSM 1491) TaxID=756982 RepID=G1XHF9_ARTOA|nr:hypothetical protein AOL_s00083g440 [Orbilia oligospora ATCC 24927]EGX47347.1 hypothetical protein AOL_s00083g440 [Orbilia oligospora ATCC 24927]